MPIHTGVILGMSVKKSGHLELVFVDTNSSKLRETTTAKTFKNEQKFWGLGDVPQ